MNLVAALVLCFALLSSVRGDGTTNTIDHDQVKPFAQPEPVTISEKAAVKYKPQLNIGAGCVSFPAVNAAGEITGGLKGTKDTEACTEAPLGSQVYGRSAWYQDKWAMMYAWYFPKNFCAYKAAGRHDWANVVAHACHASTACSRRVPRGRDPDEVTAKCNHNIAYSDGESQDLIMWNQLTDKARAALESADFGDTQVPFTDKNFETNLQAAWPF
eukprot:jgi/Phyca11/10715/fgenesh1_pm.PHYCAscaffold_53_\